MNEGMEFVVRAALIGIGATLVMDVWAAIQRLLLGIQPLNYAMVGRWMGHLTKGRFVHDPIGKAAPIPGEAILGWSAHYAIGIVFAALLLGVWGVDWARNPTLLPALITGLATVAAPFFILQPGLGAGIAASKTPQPNVARLRSLVAHTSFGVGLYLAALLFTLLMPSQG
ncbi:DUF2938 domain-containing protein [Nitratireductor soli]|uniref:DUF2938 domain-containing protein n=1 Tax=Nitratireductor soli TaxID=1670619 RepID=UPI00065E34C5|nr:DUF2938 domain-containing protein [Nitratireductor soli]